MRVLAALLAAALLAAACGGQRTQSDQEHDAQTIAGALRAADTGGVGLHLTENWVSSGGQIPKGQHATIGITGDGGAKDGRVRMTLKFTTGSKNSFDTVIGDGFLYLKPQKTDGWARTSELAATPLYPAVLLELLRESVLLAKRVDGYSLVQQGSGFAHRYVVVPASDQLEQLLAISLSTADEKTFLKTATAEIDVFLSASGDKLQRIEVHLSGTDPSSGEKTQIDSSSDYRPAKVDDIELPMGAQEVPPSQLFG